MGMKRGDRKLHREDGTWALKVTVVNLGKAKAYLCVSHWDNQHAFSALSWLKSVVESQLLHDIFKALCNVKGEK